MHSSTLLERTSLTQPVASLIHLSFKLIQARELLQARSFLIWTWGLRIDLEVTQMAQHLFQVIHVNIWTSAALKPVEGLCDASGVFPCVQKSVAQWIYLAWYSRQWKNLYSWCLKLALFCALYCMLELYNMDEKKVAGRPSCARAQSEGKTQYRQLWSEYACWPHQEGSKLPSLEALGTRRKSASDPEK